MNTLTTMHPESIADDADFDNTFMSAAPKQNFSDMEFDAVDALMELAEELRCGGIEVINSTKGKIASPSDHQRGLIDELMGAPFISHNWRRQDLFSKDPILESLIIVVATEFEFESSDADQSILLTVKSAIAERLADPSRSEFATKETLLEVWYDSVFSTCSSLMLSAKHNGLTSPPKLLPLSVNKSTPAFAQWKSHWVKHSLIKNRQLSAPTRVESQVAQIPTVTVRDKARIEMTVMFGSVEAPEVESFLDDLETRFPLTECPFEAPFESKGSKHDTTCEEDEFDFHPNALKVEGRWRMSC